MGTKIQTWVPGGWKDFWQEVFVWPLLGGMLTAEGIEPRPGNTGGRNGLGLGQKQSKQSKQTRGES